MKVRKKPVVIEAFQLTKETRWDNRDWPSGLNEAWQKDKDSPGALFPHLIWDGGSSDELCIFTLEGIHLVNLGNWILRGVKGELYPCRSDIFEETYERCE